MKFFVALILTGILSFAGALYFPWWIIAIVSFIVAVLVHQKPWKAFITGFLALFLLWGGHAFYLDFQNNHILAKKIAMILPLGGSHIALILLTAFVGALVAGFAALAGSYLRTSGHGSSHDFQTKKMKMAKDRNSGEE